ncbi:hypothetical protein ES703_90567 [subsurface metagenome]
MHRTQLRQRDRAGRGVHRHGEDLQPAHCARRICAFAADHDAVFQEQEDRVARQGIDQMGIGAVDAVDADAIGDRRTVGTVHMGELTGESAGRHRRARQARMRPARQIAFVGLEHRNFALAVRNFDRRTVVAQQHPLANVDRGGIGIVVVVSDGRRQRDQVGKADALAMVGRARGTLMHRTQLRQRDRAGEFVDLDGEDLLSTRRGHSRRAFTADDDAVFQKQEDRVSAQGIDQMRIGAVAAIDTDGIGNACAVGAVHMRELAGKAAGRNRRAGSTGVAAAAQIAFVGLEERSLVALTFALHSVDRRTVIEDGGERP